MAYILATMLALSPYSANHLQAPVNVQTVKAVEYVEVEAVVTYYSCSEAELTADCITASGEPARIGVAAHRSLPFGTVVWIEGERYVVSDRGGGLGESHFDCYVETVAEAFEKGVKKGIVRIEKVAELEVGHD